MLFNTPQFALFFVVLLLLYRGLPKDWRLPLLLGASLLFYTLWVPAYSLLLAVEIIVNYALLRGIVSTARPKLYLSLSIVFTLGLLAFFKYAAFLVEAALPILHRAGWDPPVPEFFLPLGISFYSFHIISLQVDTYRQRTDVMPSLARYALYLCFFPHLIAGPILRGNEILPQLAVGGVTSRLRDERGLRLILVGLVKKVILADFLLARTVEDAFGMPGVGQASFHLIALYSFAFQIYFDFSGYTDMARGLALLLGFELPLNFREPYLSRSPSEFWRHWHMTLSRWLRDYLYIPLGGNRKGRARTDLNLLLTMLLGGLWHGAAWTFVIWGGLHGLLLVAHRLLGKPRLDDERPLAWRDIPGILITFHLTCLLWVFFRAASFDDAWLYLRTLFLGDYGQGWPVVQTAIVGICALLHVAERWVRESQEAFESRLARPAGRALEGALAGVVTALVIAASGVGAEFIYFQF